MIVRMTTNAWREMIPRKHRYKLCVLIWQRLANYYRAAKEQELRKLSSVLEYEAFLSSSSAADYDARISEIIHRHADWRDEFSQDERLRIGQRILQRLMETYHHLPERILREFTTDFEFKVYLHSSSQSEYFARIAGCIAEIGEHTTPAKLSKHQGPLR